MLFPVLIVLLLIGIAILIWRLSSGNQTIESRVSPEHTAEMIPAAWRRRQGEPPRAASIESVSAEHECSSCGEVFASNDLLTAHEAKFHTA